MAKKRRLRSVLSLMFYLYHFKTLNTSSVNWSLTSDPTIQTGLCYAYFYDAIGRTIMKYIPGKGKNYFAYDLYNRIVMTQDANLRQTNQWAFVLYDAQSRPWRSGIITTTTVKDSIIAQAARSSAYPTLTGTYTITSETYYDDYSWISGGAPNSSLVSTYINSANFNTNYNTAPDYSQSIVASNRIRGVVTGTKRIVLNTSTYLYSVNLYDDHGRVIQVKQTNYTGGTDVLTNQYSFTGRTIRRHLYQQKSGANAQTHTLLTKYSYDAAGRLKSLIKNIDSQGDKTVSQENYNEMGQLQQKIYGASLETQNYTYNVRGWLTSINKSYTDTYNSAANYFGEDIFYDYGFTNSQVNGSIAGVKWKAAGDTIARAYGFTYDNANRVTKADFSQNVRNTTTWNNATTDFSVSNITYDGGGNLLSMSQKGLTIGSSVTIDSLKYQYYSNSNQLQKVTDAAPYTSVGLGDFRDTALAADDYAYDVNGNIIKDYNRKMNTPSNGNGAKYNLLDKPDSLVISGKGTFYYIYDAAGNTLRKQVEDYITGTTKTYLYLDGFVYFNDTLQYVQTEEGRIRWANKRNSTTGASYYAFEYDYYLRDHLGNVRTVLTEGRDTATYAATMESSDSAVVRALFSNVYDPVRTVSAKPANFDTDNNNHNVSLLTGNTGGRMGPAMILKVMAGDKVQISTFAFYNTTTQPPVTDNTLVNDLLATLVSGVTVESGGKLAGRSTTDIGNVLSPVILSALNTRAYNSSLPKAYLNWILLDDQFKYVAGNMGAMQVMAGSSKQALAPPLQTMAKNGYLYVFVSNQSTQNVYFDDLVIKHYTGPLLQEQSYYPFGLQMAGISDEAMNKLTSRNKFNGGTELEEDYGVNLYSTFYRQYDPQIGRFSGVDALAEQAIGLSAYQFGNNNPLSFNDPSGLQSRYGGESERYMDRWGNIWHTPGVLHGISSLESVPYSYEDEFYIMTQRNSGGQNGGGWGEATVKAGYNNGQAGFWVGKSIPGEGANGETLAEAKVTREFFSLNYGESNSAGGVELAVHFNDALGGFGTGLGYSSASFRLTNGTYNGSEFSFKYYSSGWEGGSRARISTYEVAGFGEGLAKGSFIAGVVLGGITVYQGIEKDGETYGSNAQLATGNAVGGLVGGWAGAETGAAIGASVGVWFFGAGAVPGAIIGGIIGGVIGGMAGGEAGEDVVRDIRN